MIIDTIKLTIINKIITIIFIVIVKNRSIGKDDG